jgi:hypothetical protein
MGMILYSASKLAKGISIAQYTDPGTEQLALNIRATLGEKYAVLMLWCRSRWKRYRRSIRKRKSSRRTCKTTIRGNANWKAATTTRKNNKKFLERTEIKGTHESRTDLYGMYPKGGFSKPSLQKFNTCL